MKNHPRTRKEQLEIAKNALAMHDDEGLVYRVIAARLGVSESETSKLVRKYKSGHFSDIDIESAVMNEINDQVEKNPESAEKVEKLLNDTEIVKGFIVSEDSKTKWLPSIYFEVEIPVGLTGLVRDLELQKAILTKLNIQEI